jgi:hypothetical protein
MGLGLFCYPQTRQMKFRFINVLEKDKNKKGDLFGRLMGDLFHSLGYDQPRLNIHKSGREVDLQAIHRLEKKIAIAECKAHSEPIGGDDLNKFVGVVDAEKRKLKKDKFQKGFSIVAYFISISGFRESAVEQEIDTGHNRVILVRPYQIAEELTNGKIVASIETAIASIKVSKSLSIEQNFDLLAHEKGWIWVLYYSNNGGQARRILFWYMLMGMY